MAFHCRWIIIILLFLWNSSGAFASLSVVDGLRIVNDSELFEALSQPKWKKNFEIKFEITTCEKLKVIRSYFVRHLRIFLNEKIELESNIENIDLKNSLEQQVLALNSQYQEPRRIHWKEFLALNIPVTDMIASLELFKVGEFVGYQDWIAYPEEDRNRNFMALPALEKNPSRTTVVRMHRFQVEKLPVFEQLGLFYQFEKGFGRYSKKHHLVHLVMELRED